MTHFQSDKSLRQAARKFFT